MKLAVEALTIVVSAGVIFYLQRRDRRLRREDTRSQQRRVAAALHHASGAVRDPDHDRSRCDVCRELGWDTR